MADEKVEFVDVSTGLFRENMMKMLMDQVQTSLLTTIRNTKVFDKTSSLSVDSDFEGKYLGLPDQKYRVHVEITPLKESV